MRSGVPLTSRASGLLEGSDNEGDQYVDIFIVGT